ncbi:hypothetical protein [Lactococcus ileimucosae]|uniref:hypothetical protein n=1 Tax=Lactococcus ileimucosae TaxID=2941329 RepID=UPI002044B441|nr:hypothetical protein [Lactococcus ileimucosae]
MLEMITSNIGRYKLYEDTDTKQNYLIDSKFSNVFGILALPIECATFLAVSISEEEKERFTSTRTVKGHDNKNYLWVAIIIQPLVAMMYKFIDFIFSGVANNNAFKVISVLTIIALVLGSYEKILGREERDMLQKLGRTPVAKTMVVMQEKKTSILNIENLITFSILFGLLILFFRTNDGGAFAILMIFSVLLLGVLLIKRYATPSGSGLIEKKAL